MATKLFVGNLSFNTTEGDMLDLFKQAGNVTSCELIMDKFTNKSRGFAFVQMGTQEEATKAIADFNGKELDGRALTVNEAKPREERPRGDFGGGGGGRGGAVAVANSPATGINFDRISGKRPGDFSPGRFFCARRIRHSEIPPSCRAVQAERSHSMNFYHSELARNLWNLL